MAKVGEKKQRQDIVQGHDEARQRFSHGEGVAQDQWNNIIVDLGERSDRHKGQPDQCRLSDGKLRLHSPHLSLLIP